ncbi:MAG: right-handed parallel beta-helix repeat-containing protein [Deltaproteobacteria bacterium]|nr:right-handed parallel beta-helix repeat-containing protein [Deltaproteobacteria bacterium]MBI3387370.1 right-handed parallel beta-helix repeat-containing protein [Deltaproteobacteria bacterium]
MKRSLAALMGSLMVGCGGGGSSAPPTPPPPNPLYVRVSGNDTNTGTDPTTALRTISKAALIARDGYTIIVGTGTYREGVTTDRTGNPAQALRFIADESGAQTGDGPGPVVIDAAGSRVGAGFRISKSPGTLIDGFTITHGSDGGIVIKSGSHDLTIEHCTVFNNSGDGIRVQDSRSVLILNNLIYANGGLGLGIVGQGSGSHDVRIFNNTVVDNGTRGITIGNTQAGSPGAMLRNNIVQNNGGDSNIRVYTPPPASVPRSEVGYDEDFDLVFPPTFRPDNLPHGGHVLVTDAQFVNQGGGDYHVSGSSPTIDKGFDLNLPSGELDRLHERTTTRVDADIGPLDLGYHFLPQ